MTTGGVGEAGVRKSVELAIVAERIGATFYKNVAEVFSDRGRTDLAVTFGFLADEEKRHESRFREMLNFDVPTVAIATLQDAPTTTIATLDIGADEYLTAVAVEMFNAAVYRKLDKIDDVVDVILKAIDLEKSSLLYYTGLKEVLGSDRILEEIIAEEKKHLVQFTTMLEENVFGS